MPGGLSWISQHVIGPAYWVRLLAAPPKRESDPLWKAPLIDHLFGERHEHHAAAAPPLCEVKALTASSSVLLGSRKI